MPKPDPSDKAKRRIDSIAHLFLSQSHKPNDHQPHRTPPQSHDQSEAKPNSNFEIEPIPAEVLITSHLKYPVQKAGLYAEYLTRRGDDIRLVNVDSYEAALIRLDSLSNRPRDDWDNPDSQASLVLCESEDIPNCLIPVLTETSLDCDNLLINIDPSFSSKTAELISRFTHITVVSECTKDSIIETYQAVKKWSSHLRPDQELALFICHAPDNETADEVYYKIADTTRQFLQKVIIPAGCHVLSESDSSSSHASLDTLDNAEDDNCLQNDPDTSEDLSSIHPALNNSHLNDLISPVDSNDLQDFEPDKLSENKVPSESRLDYSHSDDLEPETPSKSPESFSNEIPHKQRAPESSVTTPSQINTFPAIFTPIQLTSLPENDQDLLQTLHHSLAQWLITPPGCLTVPIPDFQQFEQPGSVLLDGLGRFHILMATLSAHNPLLEAALEYRQWFTKNRTGLMRMFQQLQFNPALEPGLILIKPAFSDNQKSAVQSLGSMTSHLMNLSFLDMGKNRAMLVTPAV